MTEPDGVARRKRIPLWLKISFSAWVAMWIPCYARYYGPSAFLWFCDIANFMITVALWSESLLLFSWQAVSVLAVQLAWCADLLLRFFRIHFGAADYMFDPNIPLPIRLLSLFHAAHAAILVWALRTFGYDHRAWMAQTSTALAILPLAWLVGPGKDIDW